MPKFMRYVCMTLFCFAVMAIAVHAFDGARTSSVAVWRQDMHETEILERRDQGLDVRGQQPVLLECFGPAYSCINDEIEDAVNSLIEGTRRIRARSITFDYEIFYTNDVVSIVIFATTRAVTDRTSVASVNFNPHTGALVTLVEAMGMDITPLAEGIIADMIRSDPATYYVAFSAPPTGQAFYLTNDVLVLLFDEFQLSSAPSSTRAITLRLTNIKSFSIAYHDYRISQDRYEIKMMPLRQILTGMGYSDNDFIWNPDGKEATILRNGRPMVTLVAEENNFLLNGVLQRSLETAPVLDSGTMFVPVSFFDQILGLTAYNIDEQGNIMFMTYLR